MSEKIIKMPKILVISSTPFSKKMNNGKTLSSFFTNYDKNRIAQFSYSKGDCNLDVCNNYYFLTKEDVLNKKTGCHYFFDDAKNDKFEDNLKITNSKQSFLKKIIHFFAQERMPIVIFLKNIFWNKANYTDVYKWINDFEPDIIFFQGFSMTYGYKFALDVCKKTRCPLILELTDDYTQRLFKFSFIDYINHRKYMKKFVEAINYSSKIIGISNEMKKEYEKKYKKSVDVLMNLVDYDVNNSFDHKRNMNDFVYAGNVLLNRWKILINFAKSLNKVNSNATLNIYTPDIPSNKILKNFSKIKNIRYCGSLSKEKLATRLKKCEYVVHVESFDKKSRIITRLSMSTKIPEYIMCGAKIIAIGPKEIASMKFFEENNIAFFITSNSLKKIEKGIKNIFNGIWKIDINNLKMNREYFSAFHNQNYLRNIIIEIIK